MLVLERRPTQTIVANVGLEIRVLEIHGDRVRLGLTAPPEIHILRGELLDAPAADQGAAALSTEEAQ
jgi:carbon storage regulator